jgi:hypothetical protein
MKAAPALILLALASGAACVQKESAVPVLKARPLAATAYRATLSLARPGPGVGKPGEEVLFLVRVHNAGSGVFPHRPSGPTLGDAVFLSYRVLSVPSGGVVEPSGARAALPSDLPAGGAVEVPIEVRMPDLAGAYSIRFDLVHEGLTWFEARGNPVLAVPVTVD